MFLLYRKRFGFPWGKTDILAGKAQFSNLMQRTPKELSKSRSSAVKGYSVDDFYKIYFE
jgi:hypothetical protein